MSNITEQPNKASTRPPVRRYATTPPLRREFNHDRPRTPHTEHLRELEMPDGRKLLLDRRSIAFIVEGKPEEFVGKKVTVVAFKTLAKGCPVLEGYSDIKAWWRGDGANGRAP